MRNFIIYFIEVLEAISQVLSNKSVMFATVSIAVGMILFGLIYEKSN